MIMKWDHDFLKDICIVNAQQSYIAFSWEDDPPIMVIDEGEPFDGVYVLHVDYCPNPDCNCQLVWILAVNDHTHETITLIYGWESPAFYLHEEFTAQEATLIPEGYLDPDVENPSYAPELLGYFKKMIQDEPRFTHYVRSNYDFIKYCNKQLKNNNNGRKKANRNSKKRRRNSK